MGKKIFSVTIIGILGVYLTACNFAEIRPIENETPVVSASTETPASVEEKQPETSVETEVKEEEPVASTETSVETPEEIQEPVETIPITIYIANMCGATIGGIAVIDPVTHEQVDLPNAIENETTVNLSIDWPVNEQYFLLGVYNLDLQLVTETSVDFTGIQSMAMITISGEGDLESIDASVY